MSIRQSGDARRPPGLATAGATIEPEACEHVFVTSQGSAHGRFTRAIARGNVFAAEMAARELRRLSLDDALALTALLAESDARRYERAALRWHARLSLEARLLTLAESQVALAALAALPGPGAPIAREALAALGRRHRLALARALSR